MLERESVVKVKALFRRNRLRWLNRKHECQTIDFAKKMLKWKPDYGKRSRGRPRKRWTECVVQDFSCAKNDTLSWSECLAPASDKLKWINTVSGNAIESDIT